MLLDDLADLLSTGGMSNIYQDYMPPTPDGVTTIYAAGGTEPLYTMSGKSILEQPSVQVSCRADSLEQAHQNARSAYELLSGLRNRTINGVLYHWVQAVQEPFLLGRDGNARFVVACNYDVKKDRST